MITETYVGKDSHHVESTTRLVVKIDVRLETTLDTQVDHVTSSVDSGPTDNGSTQPSVQRNDLRVGEADGMEHRATKDKEEDHAAACNNTVTTGITDHAYDDDE